MHPLDELDDLRDTLEAGKLRYVLYSGVLKFGILYFFFFKFAVHWFNILPWNEDIIQVFLASLFMGLVVGLMRWSSMRKDYELFMTTKAIEFPDID